MSRLGGKRGGDRTGAAAVEFALVGPLMILLLIAIVVYGGWFLTAQAVQSLASEGARAAIAGLDLEERRALAAAAVRDTAADMGLDQARTGVSAVAEADRVRVAVSYDLHGHPLMALGGMLPRPPMVIERSAAILVEP